jgi:enoyl-CoA hydratase/carnithine racemase
MEFQYLKISQDDTVGIITLSNPPVNALCTPMFTELKEGLKQLQNNPTIRSIVLTGEGAVFAAGADIKEIQSFQCPEDGERLCIQGQDALGAIANSDIPVIAAINGFCLGGGNELAMACHIRIASEKARFGQPEINLGIMPGLGGTQRLPRLVGLPKAIELTLTGEHISASEAKSIGLVNLVVPAEQLMTQVIQMAKKIASKSRCSVSNILRSLREGTRLDLYNALKLEAKLFGQLISTEDKKEGIAAFLEKRQPRFRDR